MMLSLRDAMRPFGPALYIDRVALAPSAGTTDAATMSRLASRDRNDLLYQHRQPDPGDTGANQA